MSSTAFRATTRHDPLDACENAFCRQNRREKTRYCAPSTELAISVMHPEEFIVVTF